MRRKMEVVLVDADSVIPNIALMKISAYHKEKGDKVELLRARLPYYPNKKKNNFIVKDADKIYCSVIFENNKKHIIGNNIIFGGTGSDLTTVLSPEIEKMEPDYSIYPDNNISYGFITRGCIRKCNFCVVPEKEGTIHKVADIKDIVKHKKVKFLDNNILAYNKHIDIFEELILKGIKCQFNQGMDIRLINKENSILLSKINYLGEYFFSFDSLSYKNIIQRKLELLHWIKPFQLKFFVYVHPSMEISETVKRVLWLKENKCLPYIMRDITCWESKYSNFYIDLSSYCNQPNIFKKMEFYEFLGKRHSNIDRISNSKKLWDENK